MSEVRARLERDSIPEPNSGCQLWLGATVSAFGYGILAWKGNRFLAHRLSWMDANGPIPDGLVIRHKCDVPGCINPEHLCAGTQAENLADMRRKGRGTKFVPETRRGEASNFSKLTSEQVAAVRASTGTCEAVGGLFGISKQHVSRLRRGERRAH